MSNEFKSWEQMSALEQASCTYWDMYKDAHGVRPRGIDTSTWTLEQFEAEFESLGQVINAEDISRKASEETSSIDFEMRIQSLIVIGAKDYEMALRWIHEAEDTRGDDDYLAWTLGLPYQYFRKAA